MKVKYVKFWWLQSLIPRKCCRLCQIQSNINEPRSLSLLRLNLHGFGWTNQQPTPVLKSSSKVKGSVFQVCTPKSCRSCKWALYCLDGFTNFKALPYKQTPLVVEPVRGSTLKASGNSGKSLIPSVWQDTRHRILWGMLRNMRFGARLWKRKCWKSGESQVFRYQTHQGNATLPVPLLIW